jgi:hypothetical protein
LKRTLTAIGFLFFYFTLEYLKRLESSEPVHAKNNPTTCLQRSLSSFWLVHFYLMKNPFWFELRGVGICYSRAVIQRTINVSPAFLEHGPAEKIAV